MNFYIFIIAKSLLNYSNEIYVINYEITMNPNKLLIEGEVLIKQQLCLKNIQFAAEYMLKKAQYRLLNPLQSYKMTLSEIYQESQLMAQLNTYSFVKQIPSMPKNKHAPTSGTKIVQTSNISISSQKQTQRNNIETNQKMPSKENPDDLQNDAQVQVRVIIQPTFSQISDRQSQESSSNSKKNRTKFQRVGKAKKQKSGPQQLPLQQLNFKKKNMGQNKQDPLKQSPSMKIEGRISDSQQDSFDNFAFVRSDQDDKRVENQQVSFISSVPDSYQSSILQNGQEFQIGVVSQHASQHQFSNAEKFLIRQISSPDQTNFKQSKNKQQRDQHQPTVQNQAEISNYLMRLESFQVQQQMLIKRTNKIWNRELNCMRKIKQMKWADLKLPKPDYKATLLQYADVIQ